MALWRNALAAAAVVLLAAPLSAGERVRTKCPPDSFLTYQNFGGPFFSEWCTGCHSSALSGAERQDAPDELNFDTLDGIRTALPEIYEAAAAGKEMPPAGGPRRKYRKYLREWIACGARD